MEILSTDPISNELMECVVTLKSMELLESFYEDMETPGGDLYIPNRQVPVYMRRPMSVNTHYMLTAEEINSLRSDPRVVAVNPANLIRQSKKLTRILTGVTNSGSNYDKRGYPTAIDSLSTNWALLRCTLGTQVSNWGDDNATGGLVKTGAYGITNTTAALVTNPGNTVSSSFISALSFAGTANQWLKCVSASTNLALGTSNWCIECWFRQTETRTGYAQIIGLRATNGSPTNAGQYCPISIGTQSGKLLVASSSNGTGWNISSPDQFQIPDVIVNAQWYHVAAVRNGNFLDVYLDGTSVLRKNVTGVNYTQAPLPFMIGGSDFASEDPFKGQITNVRVTRSAPVYTSNFAVPTSPLNAITGTILLIKEGIADLSGISTTITNHNNVTLITVTPGPFGDNSTPPAPPPAPPYYPPAPPPPPAPATGTKPVIIEPTGQHVDVVIVDGISGVPNHPEFARVRDGTGGSRYVQFNWHQLNTLAASLDDDGATLLTGSYSYAKATNVGNANHGAHTAGSVAGNSQGWAVDANIYQIDPVAGTIDSLIIWDYIRAFHKSKPINPATGLRNPTICNCSYGSSLTHSTSAIGGIGPIIEGTRRGSKIGNWSQNTPLTQTQLTNLGIYASSNGTATIPILWDDEAADVQQAIADGIIVVGAAGNESQYIDKVGGLDYNNSYYFRYTGGASPVAFQLNYHRGTSPGAAIGAICVGSVDANRLERKAYYSNTGPRLDVFAPGTWIISSVSDISGEGYGTSVDARSNSYFIGKSIGTSMATPQVTGVLACVLQRYPRMSPAKALKYITYYSKTNQMFSPTVGTSPTWVTDQYHLQGANNRYLFMPYERPLTGMVYPKKNYWVRLNNESTSTVITPPGSLVFNEFMANLNSYNSTLNYLSFTTRGNIPKFHDLGSSVENWTVESWVNCFNDAGEPRTLLSTCGTRTGTGINISVGSAGVVIIDFYNGVGTVTNNNNNNKNLRITTDPSTISSLARLPAPRQWFHLLITGMGDASSLLVRVWINGFEISAVWEIFNSSNTRIAGPLPATGGVIPITNWYNENHNEATYPLAIGRGQVSTGGIQYFSGLITNLAMYYGPKIGHGAFGPIAANFTPTFPIETRTSPWSSLRTLLLVNNDATKFNMDPVGGQTIVNCSGGADGLTANVTPVTFRATSPAGFTIPIPGIGGSLYFNGTNMLNFNSNQAFNFGANGFTLEAWIYPTSLQTTTIMGCQAGPSPGRGWLFGLKPLGTGLVLTFGWTPTGTVWSETGPNYFTSTTPVLLNQWNHVVFVKRVWIGSGAADRYSFYINGKGAGTGAGQINGVNVIAGTIAFKGTFGIGGTPNETTSGQTYFNGYMNNIRVTANPLYGSTVDGTIIDFIPEKNLNSSNNGTILLMTVSSDVNKYRNDVSNNLGVITNGNYTNKAGSTASTVTGPTYETVGQAVSQAIPTILTTTAVIPATGESGRVYPRPKKYVRV